MKKPKKQSQTSAFCLSMMLNCCHTLLSPRPMAAALGLGEQGEQGTHQTAQHIQSLGLLCAPSVTQHWACTAHPHGCVSQGLHWIQQPGCNTAPAWSAQTQPQ